MARDDFRHIDELVHRWSPKWAYDPAETEPVKECFRPPGSLAAALAYYRSVGVRPPGSLHQNISVPCTAFAGTDDPVFSPADFERARRRFASRYEVVAMPGGHFLQREHPERFCADLLAHLRAPVSR